MEAASGRAERTYGNLRHPKSAGLWHFGTIGTALAFGAIMVWILVVIFVGILPGVVLFALFVPATVYLTVPDRHRQTRLEKLAVKIGHRRQRAQGSHVRVWAGGAGADRSVLAARDPRADGAGGDRGRLWPPSRGDPSPSMGRATVVIETEPDGAALVDQEDQDRRVASWGAWHAQLAEEPGLVACTVTIETAPATARRLRDTMGRRIDPHAPAAGEGDHGRDRATARRHGAAEISGYITLTYALRPGWRRR